MAGIRILTWNLWGRNGPWEARQTAIAAVLAAEAPDVVCLQEAWVVPDGPSQAALLAEDLGYHHVDADQHRRQRSAPTIGNAVLARWPIERSETMWLPRLSGGLPYRTLLRAEVSAPVGTVAVHSTHFDWQYDASGARVLQAEAVARFVAAHRGDPTVEHPPILAGDLNAVPDADEIRLLTGRRPVPAPGLVFQDAWELAGDGGRGITWTRGNPYCNDAAWPERRLDYVLVGWPRPRPLGNPVVCRVVGDSPVGGVQPSDHYGVVVDLA
jgi:endonuclease/exonuclease/phosphatase family metal-dependent hydrolase